MPVYVEDCFLCPGNPRISGLVNEGYGSVYVFDNDHPAFSLAAPAEVMAAPAMFSARPARGICRVVCYAPQHNLTLAEMSAEGLSQITKLDMLRLCPWFEKTIRAAELAIEAMGKTLTENKNCF